mgnify:CR=1 FL=1
MSRRTKRFKIWFTRHVPVPLLLIGVAAVVILCLNDEVSPSRNYSYLQEIVELKSQIRQNLDSAEYYRTKRNELASSPEELEHIAREQYQMQKPDEEVYLIR